MSFFPSHHPRQVSSLDGLWEFAWLGTTVDLDRCDPCSLDFTATMAVPQCFDTVTPWQGARGTAAYRTGFRVSVGLAAQLRFGGLGLWARVYVDGLPLKDWNLPYTPFRVDLPPADHELRSLVVLVDNRLDPARVPLAAPHFDFYLYGGIYRSVSLQVLERWYIERLVIDATDIEGGMAQISLHVAATGSARLPQNLDIEAVIDPDSGLAGTPTRVSQVVRDGQVCFGLKVPHHRLWSPANPALHVVGLRLMDGARVVDDCQERFGFRRVDTADGQIRLNGQGLKLLGFCRHEAHPASGPALPLPQLVQDLALLKDLGCNFVRGSHYCQDQRFLSLCDQMGILVFEESLAWGNDASQFARPGFADQQEEQTRLMVRASINHPSVIIWGFLNEGRSNDPAYQELYSRLAKAVRAEDPSRLVSYATMFPFDDLNLDLVDVISTNIYPGWYTDSEEVRPLSEIEPRIQAIRNSLVARGLADKPQILSEIGAAALYGWRDPHNGHYTEQYQSDLLETAISQVLGRPDLAGIAIWQFCDGRTYSSGRATGRPRGFNNKGVMDEYRRPKQAYGTVKRLFGAGLAPYRPEGY